MLKTQHTYFIIFILLSMSLIVGCIGGGTATTSQSVGSRSTGIVAGKAMIADSSDNSGITIILEDQNAAAKTMQAISKIPRKQRTPQLTQEIAEQDSLLITTTDSEGSFTLSEVPTGKYLLTAQKLDNIRATKPDVDVKADAVTTVDINVDIPGTIGGLAYLEQQSDHSGIIIYLEGTSFITTTDEDGAYSFKSVPKGTYTVVFKEYGYETSRQTGIVVNAESGTEIDDVVLAEISELSNVGSIAAHVLDKGLMPLEDIYVYLKEYPSFNTRTDENGYFKIDSIPKGVYSVVVAGNYVRKEEKNISVAGKHLTEMDDVILDTTNPLYGIISGKVIAGDYPITVGLVENNVVVQQITVEDDGSFIIPAIVPGTYKITANSIGFVSYASGSTTTVNAGSTQVLTDIQMEKAPGIISGTVRTSNNEPVENVSVSAGVGYTAKTLSDGSYFLSVSEGTYSVSFDLLGYQSGFLANIEVFSAQETQDNDILLSPVNVNSIINELQLAEKPTDISYNAPKKTIYVLCKASNKMHVIDAETFTVKTSIETSSKPSSVAFSHDGNMIYVCSEWNNKIDVYSAASHVIVNTIELGMNRRPVDIVTSSSGYKYVANTGNDTISVINSDDIVIASFTVGRSPIKLLLNEGRQRLYCLNSDSGNVSIFNTVTNEILRNVDIGIFPVDGYIEANHLIALNKGTDSFAYFDLDSEQVSENVKTGVEPEGIAVSTDSVYISSYSAGTIQQHSRTGFAVLDTFSAGMNPTRMVVCNNDRHLLVLKPETRSILVYLINR
jgi:YVTN family beta-propeller protein